MTVVYELARLRTAYADAHTVYYVVESALQKGEHIFTGYALHSVRFLVASAELTFLNAVNSLNFLLFAELFAVFGNFLSRGSEAVSAGRHRSLFERAFAVVTFIAF